MGLKSYDQDCQTAEEIRFWDDLYRLSQNNLRAYPPCEGIISRKWIIEPKAFVISLY